MRETVAAVVVLAALALAAVAPSLWKDAPVGEALKGGPTPRPTQTIAARSPAPSTLWTAATPVQLTLPSGCAIETLSRHDDALGATWQVQCGSALANLAVVSQALRQGWLRVEGPPIGVGMQTYQKATLTMRIGYRLDGAAYAERFVLEQDLGAPGGSLARATSPLAYLRVPAGIDLPAGCAWATAPAGFTDEGAYRMPFACPGVQPAQIRGLFTQAIARQGWVPTNGGFGFLTFSKKDLQMTAGFVDGSTDPTAQPWIVEALCCFSGN